jgi:hypothetical protein
VAAKQQEKPLRGTQLLVDHMASVSRRPALVAIEIAWRWLFGIPFFLLLFQQVQRILAACPLESSGLASIDTQNPWVAATQISNGISYYQPHFGAVLRWLLPAAAVAWVVLSGLGRAALLTRLPSGSAPRLPFRPLTVTLLQAAWLVSFAATFWCWFRAMRWVAVMHIAIAGEPDLMGYFIWAIVLSLGFFTAWALLSWTVSVAPLLALLEDRLAISALGQSLKLGKAFAGKLAEINLVLGIVKLALAVVAMVFSAAPLPFSDVLSPAAMHFVWAASAVFFLVTDDFFQIVRLKAFLEFWKFYRGAGQC